MGDKVLEKVKKLVYEILSADDSGHGYDHSERVCKLALKFAIKEKADEEIVSLIALLHDVDDYKLFGKQQAQDLTNAKKIMNCVKINEEKQEKVLSSLRRIGYRKSLAGIRPITLEGKIVSDADMCEAIGANGILRTHEYGLKYGKPFFYKKADPNLVIKLNEYRENIGACSLIHLFEKSLKLKDLMLTDSGKREATIRHKTMVYFLYRLFEEEDAIEWEAYLDNYLEDNSKELD